MSRVIVIGEGRPVDQIVATLEDAHYQVETADCLCVAMERFGETGLDLVVFATHQPWEGVRQYDNASVLFGFLRKHYGLIAIATNAHPEIEPSYLKAGVDLVVPLEAINSPSFNARLCAIARRVRRNRDWTKA